MAKRQTNIVGIRSKPQIQNDSFFPSKVTRASFKLPEEITLQNLKNVAETIDLRSLGVIIPCCKYPERFEAGFRYGLAHNMRTNAWEHYRPLFSKGFCWAKIFYRDRNPDHPLAASGSFKAKITPSGQLIKIKDI